MRDNSVFRSAVIGEDGEVDPGYLGLYMVMVIVLGAIPSALVLAAVHLVIADAHPLDLVGVAAVISAAGVAFGAAAGGVGLFRRGDQPHAATATTTTTTTATAPAAAVPAVPAETVIAAAGGVEPMPAKIAQHDVGKTTALLEPKPKRRKRGR